MPAPITLKNQQGQLFDYDDPSKAQADIDNLGFAQATPDEVSAADTEKANREKYGSAGQQVVAMGELAFSAATGGFGESKTPEAIARRQQLRKQSPVLAMGSEVAGSAALGAATGGLGEAAGLGGIGLRAGADFASGLSLEAEQAKEQKRDISIGNVAMWTLGGIAAESLVRAGARAVRGGGGVSQAVAEDAAQTAANAAPGGFQNNVVPKALNDAQAYRTGEAFGQTEKELSKSEKISIAQNWDENVNAVRTLAEESGNSFLDSFDNAHGIYNKPEDVRGIVESNPEAQSKFFEQHTEAAAKLADYLDSTGKPRTAATIRQHINAMNTAEDEAELFIAGDQLKRSVQKFRKRAMIAARTSGNDPFNELAAHFDDVERPLRGDLEKSKIWGETAASKQAEENAAWSGKDGFINNAAEFQRQFYAQDAAGFDYDGIKQMHWNDDAFVSFLNKDKIGQRRILSAGDKMLAKAEELTKIKEAAGIRPEDLVQIKQDLQDMKSVVEQVRTLSEVRADKGIFERVQAQVGKEGGARGAVLSALDMVPGPGHWAAKHLDERWLPESKFSPLQGRDEARAAVKSRLENIGKATTAQAPLPSLNQLGSVPHADEFGNVRRVGELTAQELNDQDLDQLSEHGRAYVDRQASLFASSGQREAPLPPAAVRFADGYPSLTDAYNARVAWLKEAALNPRALVDKLASSFGHLPETHPLLFSGVASTAATAAAYMQAHLPPGVAISMAHPNGTPASRDQMAEFARLWDAVWTPQNAIRDLATGHATPSQLQAVADVHPEVFRDLQAKAVTHLARRTKPAPYETQRYLDQLLKLDGAANPALSWSVANSIQAAIKSGGVKGSNIVPTPTQRNVGPNNPRGIASLKNGPTFGGT